MIPRSRPAESLTRHGQIHARLQLEIMDVVEEIERLEDELRTDQDPGKMSRIQSQIGVRPAFVRRYDVAALTVR
jgi:hypothetical protein